MNRDKQTFSYVDGKAEWGSGPWVTEPDKATWTTSAGLPGMIVRNDIVTGALCGYAGVGREHPLYGLKYNDEAPALAEAFAERLQQPIGDLSRLPWEILISAVFGGDHLKPTPGTVMTVHGGLTYADDNQLPAPEQWESWRSDMLACRADALQYPNGDAAEAWRERGHLMDDFEGFVRYHAKRGVCDPSAGDVWWFGFDCGHAGDFSPKMHRLLQTLGGGESFAGSVYRDFAYVEAEVEELAKQLLQLSDAYGAFIRSLEEMGGAAP